jgi:glycosyltransferase involved in cell wall biosynthesis
VHGEAAARNLRERFELRPSQIVAIVPHGNYIDCYPNEIGCAEARGKLGLKSSDFVFLFFGMIRPYKGVTELVEAFRQLSASDTQLVIAGRPLNQKLEKEVRVLIGDSDRIHFNPAFIPDAEVQTFMNSSDVVVFPYRNILTSGAVVLAMSFGRACLAPELGTLTDVLDERGAILYEPGRPNALAESMILALERRDSLAEMGRHNQKKATTWRWRRIGSETAEVYRKICNR